LPTTLDCALLRDLFGTERMRAIFDSERLVQGWLDAEAALARALADVGLIPRDQAEAIAAACRAELYDLDVLRSEIAASQHPLVPLVRALAGQSGAAGHWAHWGATTQDIIDTGLVLQVRDAVRSLAADLARALVAVAALAERHAATAMPGRTHGQHAVPITFGLKAASWGDELVHARSLLLQAGAALPASLAGAAGTLASLGADAQPVLEAYCARLGLPLPEGPWHAGRFLLRDLCHALAEIGAGGERIAAEIVRLQASEVDELREPAMPGHVGSSTMPQKRNPMTSEYLIGSARLLRGALSVVLEGGAHAGERDMGPWSAEWLAVPQACILASSVADKLAWILEGLEVRVDRMRANLALTRGAIVAEELMMRLGREIGHEAAHVLVARAAQDAARTGRGLDEIAIGDDPDATVELVDPADYVGWSAEVAAQAARRVRAHLAATA
jgi:3-carboxy-cis,cis-muconate cycloisomerase